MWFLRNEAPFPPVEPRSPGPAAATALLKYPDIPRYSIGWRMGSGEAYLSEWQPWYQSLTLAGQQAYHVLYLEPEAWAGFYALMKKMTNQRLD